MLDSSLGFSLFVSIIITGIIYFVNRDKYINSDGTIRPQALEEMFDAANESYMHELFHSFQKNRIVKDSDSLPRAKGFDNTFDNEYLDYRARPEEIESWGIQFAGKKNFMNRDALSKMLDDLVFDVNRNIRPKAKERLQIVKKQIMFGRNRYPCMRGNWGLLKVVININDDEVFKNLFSDFYKLETSGKINDNTLVPFGDCKKFRHYRGRGKIGPWNDKKLNKKLREYLEKIIREEVRILLREKRTP